MTKFKGYYYTTKKNQDGEFKYYIWNKNHECLVISEDTYGSRPEAVSAAKEEINEHYS